MPTATAPAIETDVSRRDLARDHHLARRDDMVDALMRHGGEMTPAQLARELRITPQAVCIAAPRWPRYFELGLKFNRSSRPIIRVVRLHRDLRAHLPR
jgi:hypothetical protein